MSKAYKRIFVFSILILLFCSLSVSALTYDEVKVENYDMFMRVWSVFGIILVCLIYNFFFYDQKKIDNEYLMSKKFRLNVQHQFSKWGLVFAPFFFLFFHPDYEIIQLYELLLLILTPLTALYLNFLSLDLLKYGIKGVFVKLGMKTDDKNTKRFVKEHLGGRT